MRIISGKYRSRVLKMPHGVQTRPTSQKVRKAIFDVLFGGLENKKVLDLFSGSGAIGFEALSCGAKHVSFVEKHKNALTCIRQNVKNLGLESQCSIFSEDVFRQLDKLSSKKERFDIIFADPPYKGELAKKCLLKISNCDILHPLAVVVIEHSKQDELSDVPSVLILWQQKNYGDTFVSFYAQT